jgi:hypothetical protein
MTRYACRSIVSLSLVGCLAGSALADKAWEPPGKWSLAEREQWAKLRDELLVYLKDANEHCGGTKIEVDFDYESFRGKFKDNESYGLDAYGRAHAAATLMAVDNICKIGDREKKAVAAGVKKVKIAHGKKGKDAKSTISYANKTLLPVIEPAGSAAGTWQDELEKWIKTKL